MHKKFCRWLMIVTAVVACGLAVPTLALAETADDHAAEGGGDEPPLSAEPDLALWSGITFVVFVLVLKKFAWTPLISGLDSRESSIRTAIAEANAAREKAERMLAEHEQRLQRAEDEVREILAEARRDAESTKQSIISEAESEAEAMKNRSIAEIERAKDVALRDLFDAVSQRVVLATEHILGRALSEDDQNRFVDEALSQFADSSSS